MTKNFDKLVKIFLEDGMTDGGVFGADGSYPTDDPRTPFVLGTYSRRGKVKTKKRRKRKKTIKESIDSDYWQYEGCGILALYINELLKLPIIIFKDDSTIAHVGNLLDGKIIDSIGVRTIQEIKDHYYDIPNIVAEKISKKELLEYMGDDDQPLYGPDEELEKEAKQFIVEFIMPLVK